MEKEEIQSGIMLLIKNKAEEPIEIEYAYHLEKNDKRFEFNSEVDEKEKETLLSVISTALVSLTRSKQKKIW